jgi:hypothetical protein
MAGKSGGMLAVLALGGIALFMATKKSSASTSSGGTTPGTGKYDQKPAPPNAVMPLSIEQTVDSELANDTNPTSLNTFAASLLPMWPAAAALLQARAQSFSVNPSPAPTPAPAPAPAPPITPPIPQPVLPPQPAPAPVPAPVTPPVVPPPSPVVPPPTPAPIAVSYPQWATTTSGTAGMTNGPDVSSVAIPATYQAQSDETTAVQTALNAAATQLGFPLAQLTVDGLYGAATQQMAAMFQQYVNDTNMAPVSGSFAALTVDGLAGPSTQNYLLNFGTIPTGGPY